MKTLTPVLGLSLLLVSSLVAPLGAQAKPLFSSSPQQQETLPNSSTSLPDNSPVLSDTSASMPKKMAAYRDCINANANINGADFKQVNKFCSCVADQTIQGSTGSLSDCATASSGGGGGGAMSVIGEVAPSVISGVISGIGNRRNNGGGGLLGGGGGGGILGGLGDLLGGGGLLGGGSNNDNNDNNNSDSSGGGFSIRDLLKNRF
jgi:hypothetical protein